MNQKYKTAVFFTNINFVNKDHSAALSSERAAKAARLKQEADKKRSTAAGVLLSKFLPGEEIYTDEFGKPQTKSGVCFNLSHSGDYAVLAVSNAPVGIDIEKSREIDELRLGKIVYCENEMNALRKAGNKRKLFFELWTKKEALLKCMGKGFHRNAKSVDVSKDYFEENGARYGFKLYYIDDYTLCVCSEAGDFPDEPEFVKI
ncbi:MAG TPA: hypothetical protein DEO32_04135 [Ruminococcaceae bacterium]|nr:hypothetical protein [Oscillospiraceae bacterium]